MEIKTIHDLVPGYRVNRWTFVGIVNRKGGNWIHARCDCGTERDKFPFTYFIKKRPYSCTHCWPRKGPHKIYNLKNGKWYRGWKIIRPHPKFASTYEVECKEGHYLKNMVVTYIMRDEGIKCKKCPPRRMRKKRGSK